MYKVKVRQKGNSTADKLGSRQLPLARRSHYCGEDIRSKHIGRARRIRQVSSLSTRAVSNFVKQPGGLGKWKEGLQYCIREATMEDWWQIAEIHCHSFYPKARCLLAILLRFNRVESLKGPEVHLQALLASLASSLCSELNHITTHSNGSSHGEMGDTGNFACFAACLDTTHMAESKAAVATVDQAMRAAVSSRMPSFLQAFVSRPLRTGFGQTPEERGILGTVILDTLGENVPPRERDGMLEERDGIAYLSNLAVHQMFRRQGIGRRLLAHAAKVAGEWGCHAVVLQCDPRNKGARQMYVDAGFRHVAMEPKILQFLEGRIGTRLELMIKRVSKGEKVGETNESNSKESISHECAT